MSHPLSTVDLMSTSPPSVIGARAEAAVTSALVRAGRSVFLPTFGAHSRIDLVYENGNGLVRVQCKTSKLGDGVLIFRTCSNTANRPVEYRGEIDAFGVYSPELDDVCLVPVDVAPIRRCYLRLQPVRNGQQKGVLWAADYHLGPP